MTRPTELRCTAPHPGAPGRVCNQFIAEAFPGTVQLIPSAELVPGVPLLKCKRCDTKYQARQVAQSLRLAA